MTRLSNWKEESDLFEVVTGKMTDEKALKKVDEKKGIKNKVVINPKLTEAIKEMGGELIEANEEEGKADTVDTADEAKKKSEEQKKKQIENKQKRAQMIKKQVLMKKLIAVRSGSEDIVAHHEPKGNYVKEASAVLDANKKLEKERKTKKDKAELAKLTHIYKGMKKGIYNSYEPEGESIGERTLSSYIPSDRQGEARRANLDYTKAQLKKKEDQSTKNRGDLSKRDAGKMAKERLRTKKIMSMGEGSAYGLWKGDGKRKLPGDKKKKEDVKEATRYKKEKGYDKGGTKKPSGKKDAALSAVVAMIRSKHGKSAIVGQGSRQQKKVKGAKSTAGTGKYKRAADEKKQLKKDAKEMGYGSDTKGYVETRARYGSKENMKSGRGLGT